MANVMFPYQLGRNSLLIEAEIVENQHYRGDAPVEYNVLITGVELLDPEGTGYSFNFDIDFDTGLEDVLEEYALENYLNERQRHVSN